MIYTLTHKILPVFAILALGFLMRRGGKASEGEARALNRVAFLVLQPALIFPLIAGLDIEEFELGAVLIYALCEAIAFGATYAVTRFVLGREHLEAWLLSMAVVFVNSLMYVWPISYLIYGEAAATPITSIVALDASVSFAFFIISMEVMAGKGGRAAAKGIVTNPVLIAITAGAAFNFAGLGVPEPVLTAMRFAGVAAPPLTLFALGVILGGQRLMPSPTVAVVTGLKLVFFPFLVAGALALMVPDAEGRALFILNAAGPSGAMSFALALLYGVRTDAIAPVIIWTSLLSLFSLAWLA